MRRFGSPLSTFLFCLVAAGCATNEPEFIGVVFPDLKSGPCTDLQRLRSNDKVTLSEHNVISSKTIAHIEQEYVFTKPPYNIWPHLKPKLRDGDEMFYMQYSDHAAEFVEFRWYFFRDGCVIAMIPWGSS